MESEQSLARPGDNGVDVVDGEQLQIRQTQDFVTGFFVETWNDELLHEEINGGNSIEQSHLRGELLLSREQRKREYVQYGRNLSTIAKDFRKTCGEKVRSEARKLPSEIRLSEVYEPFSQVVKGLFEDGFDSSKIVILLMFGYEYARDLLRRTLDDHMLDVIRLLVRFMGTERMAIKGRQVTQSIFEWVTSEGGWRSVFMKADENGIAVAPRPVMEQLFSKEVMGFISVNAVMIIGMWLRRR